MLRCVEILRFGPRESSRDSSTANGSYVCEYGPVCGIRIPGLWRAQKHKIATHRSIQENPA